MEASWTYIGETRREKKEQFRTYTNVWAARTVHMYSHNSYVPYVQLQDSNTTKKMVKYVQLTPKN